MSSKVLALALLLLASGRPSGATCRQPNDCNPTPITDREILREVRAVEMLERVGTPEACKLLELLAKGAEDALLTREAQRSLRRLSPDSRARR